MAFEKLTSLIGKLRKYREAHYIMVFCDDEEEPFRVNLTEARDRAKRAKEAIGGRHWTKVVFHDKKDGVVVSHDRCVEDEPPPMEIETLNESTGRSSRVAEVNATVNIVLRAMEMSLAYNNRNLQPLVDAFVRQNDHTARRLEAAQREADRTAHDNLQLQAELLRAATKIAAKQLPADANGESVADEVMAEVLPNILARMFGGPPQQQQQQPPNPNGKPNGAPPTNGANGANGQPKRKAS